MNLTLLDEHTLATNLLTPGGYALDVGCRNFRFSGLLIDRGLHVIGIDPAPDVWLGYDGPVVGIQAALEHGGPDRVKLHYEDNGNGTHVVDASREGVGIFESPVVRLPWIMETYQIKHWAVVKFDLEGGEFALLQNWPGPIATQVSVEFHSNNPRTPPNVDEVHAQIRAHMSQWYDVVYGAEKVLQWGRWDYFDLLFVLKPSFR